MTILIVDHNEQDLQSLAGILSALVPEAVLLPYRSSLEALLAARSQEIDIAFLETTLPELDGMDMGQYLKELYPYINLIFSSKENDRSLEAFALHASGYLKKPVAEKDVGFEITDLRYPFEMKNKKQVFVQTFGNFEVFFDGKPVLFKYSRTKEIVALLVMRRGAQTTNGEIIATLWEDDGDPDKKASYLSNLRQDLQNTLSKLQLNRIIIKQRGSLAIATELIECDLYDWLENMENSKYRYLGEFMNQYSWAESMHAELDEISFHAE